MGDKPKTITLPKQTQVSLNYWNSTNPVDGCEFSTTFCEPLTLNLGDTIGVRNSSLDTSSLSNDLIVIEDDLILEFEMVYYAMIRKTEMNFETFNSIPRNHQAWIYAKDSKNYLGANTNYDPTGTGKVFVNPLWSFMYQAFLGTYLAPTTALDEMPEMIANFEDAAGTRGVCLNPRPNAFAPLGYNTGSTLPNTTAQNTPVLMMNSLTGKPFTRKVSITLKAGFYTRAGVAVEITTLISSLRTPITTNLPFPSANLTSPILQTQPLWNCIDTSTAGGATLQRAIGNCEVWGIATPITDPIYPEFGNLNQINKATEGINPFQVDVLAQHTADTIQYAKAPLGAVENIYVPQFGTDQFQKLVLKMDRGFVGGSTNPFTSIPMGESIIGVVNDVNFSGFASAVHFEPFTEDWRILGNNCCPAGVNPQYMGDNEDFSTTNLYGVDINYMRSRFDTSNPASFQVALADTAVPTYQVQFDPIGSINEIKHQFLPITINPSVQNPYTCGTYGTPQISLLYDQDKNLFKFADLHTPILTAPDNKSGAETPSIIRSIGKFTGAYDTANTFANPEFSGDVIGNQMFGNQNTEAINDRHSGIIFTSIKAKVKSTGLDSSFWKDIGFDVDAITINTDLLPSKEFNKVISAEKYNSLTTGELFGISQNTNSLNTVGSNNELVQSPLRFTYQLNYNSILDVANISGIAPLPPFPANVGSDSIFASTNSISILASNAPNSVLNALGGNILLEITGYGGGSELQDKDAFAVKSIVNLYYLNSNTYLSTEGDGYTYTHLSNTPQTISSLKVRILNPITKEKLTKLLGKNNSVYITITQNKEIELPQ